MVVVALIVAALLLANSPRHTPKTVSAGPVPISSVTVWIVPPQQYPDNASEAVYTFDRSNKTEWYSDHYNTSNFSDLGGEGLAVHLSNSAALHQLRVTSYTLGWAASTYVADAATDPTTLAGWGAPTDSQSNIQGDATFNLSGRQGNWVLLYMTNTGPKLRIGIAELAVS